MSNKSSDRGQSHGGRGNARPQGRGNRATYSGRTFYRGGGKRPRNNRGTRNPSHSGRGGHQQQQHWNGRQLYQQDLYQESHSSNHNVQGYVAGGMTVQGDECFQYQGSNYTYDQGRSYHQNLYQNVAYSETKKSDHRHQTNPDVQDTDMDSGYRNRITDPNVHPDQQSQPSSNGPSNVVKTFNTQVLLAMNKMKEEEIQKMKETFDIDIDEIPSDITSDTNQILFVANSESEVLFNDGIKHFMQIYNDVKKEISDLPRGYVVGNIEIYIHLSNITILGVDGIVNAANGGLRHDGGVAKAIADKAGHELKKASNEAVQIRKKKFQTSDVIQTTAGRLPCHVVLHAVGPIWPGSHTRNTKAQRHQDEAECIRLLNDTFHNILQYAEMMGLNSIAIPPVSSGIYGVPHQNVSEAILRALLSFAESACDTSLKEIHLVDINTSILQDVSIKLQNANCVSTLPEEEVSLTIRNLEKPVDKRKRKIKSMVSYMTTKDATHVKTEQQEDIKAEQANTKVTEGSVLGVSGNVTQTKEKDTESSSEPKRENDKLRRDSLDNARGAVERHNGMEIPEDDRSMGSIDVKISDVSHVSSITTPDEIHKFDTPNEIKGMTESGDLIESNAQLKSLEPGKRETPFKDVNENKEAIEGQGKIHRKKARKSSKQHEPKSEHSERDKGANRSVCSHDEKNSKTHGEECKQVPLQNQGSHLQPKKPLEEASSEYSAMRNINKYVYFVLKNNLETDLTQLKAKHALEVTELPNEDIPDDKVKILFTSDRPCIREGVDAFYSLFIKTRKEVYGLPKGYNIDNLKVFVHENNITGLYVDGIVNPANEGLILDAGVGKAIAERAGPQIAGACKEAIKQNKSHFLTSDVIGTAAGQLPCDVVLHAVGPLWPDSSEQTTSASKTAECVTLLNDTFCNVLLYAEMMGLKRIAIPPIGAGASGVPIFHVAEAIADAIKFCATGPKMNHLQEVHIVDVNSAILQEVSVRLRSYELTTLPSKESVHSVITALHKPVGKTRTAMRKLLSYFNEKKEGQWKQKSNYEIKENRNQAELSKDIAKRGEASAGPKEMDKRGSSDQVNRRRNKNTRSRTYGKSAPPENPGVEASSSSAKYNEKPMQNVQGVQNREPKTSGEPRDIDTKRLRHPKKESKHSNDVANVETTLNSPGDGVSGRTVLNHGGARPKQMKNSKISSQDNISRSKKHRQTSANSLHDGIDAEIPSPEDSQSLLLVTIGNPAPGSNNSVSSNGDSPKRRVEFTSVTKQST